MIAIQICADLEWVSLKNIFRNEKIHYIEYPFGRYFIYDKYATPCLFYYSGATKTLSSAACQYAIDHWKPEIVFVAGTCGGVAPILKERDIIIANKTVQYDYTERLGKRQRSFYKPFIIDIDNSWINIPEIHFKNKIYEGCIATSDQDMDYNVQQDLRKKHVLKSEIYGADWESGAISVICKMNNVRCCIIRGVSDIPLDSSPEDAIRSGKTYKENTPLIMNILLTIVLSALVEMHIRHNR